MTDKVWSGSDWSDNSTPSDIADGVFVGATDKIETLEVTGGKVIFGPLPDMTAPPDVHVPGVQPIGPIPPPPPKPSEGLDWALEMRAWRQRMAAEFQLDSTPRPSFCTRLWRRAIAWLNADSKKPFLMGKQEAT